VARFVALPNDEWLDVVELRSAQTPQLSRAKGPNRSGIAHFRGHR
jgi:hypothetical protein